MAFWKKMLSLYAAVLVLVCACAELASQAVDRFSDLAVQTAASGLPVVVVDPGHGGEDGGAVSPNGVLESGLNLEISLRTADLLRFLGLPVILTRDADVSVCDPDAVSVSEKKVSDLKNRVRLVNGTPGAVLLSIHQNMFPSSRYFGAQVFYAATDGSRTLAETLQAFCAAGLDPENRRRAKQAEDIYLLKKLNGTGVLVECGFLSNPGEERKLRDASYQKKISAVLAAGLTAFFCGTTDS